jgi:integrase
MLDGTEDKKTTTCKRREDAKAKLDMWRDMNKKNLRMADKKWTVGEWMDYWLTTAARTRTRRTTWTSYESMTRLYIKPLLGSKVLAELGIRDVQLAIDKMAVDEAVGGSLYRRFKQVLSTALTRAVREEILFRNVAQYVELPKHIKKEIIPWTVEEALRFLANCQGHMWYPAMLIQLLYGTRRGEAIGLRWSDIDWKNNRFFIRQQLIWYSSDGIVAEDVKTVAGRRELPLIEIVKEQLIILAEEQGVDLNNCFDPLAPYSTENVIIKSKVGGPINPDNYGRAFLTIVKRAGVRVITNHTMRHTLATLLSRLGVPKKDIQRILGHTDARTTENIYMHGNSDVQTKALEAVSGIFKSALAAYSQTIDSELTVNLTVIEANNSKHQRIPANASTVVA